MEAFARWHDGPMHSASEAAPNDSVAPSTKQSRIERLNWWNIVLLMTTLGVALAAIVCGIGLIMLLFDQVGSLDGQTAEDPFRDLGTGFLVLFGATALCGLAASLLGLAHLIVLCLLAGELHSGGIVALWLVLALFVPLATVVLAVVAANQAKQWVRDHGAVAA